MEDRDQAVTTMVYALAVLLELAEKAADEIEASRGDNRGKSQFTTEKHRELASDLLNERFKR